MNKRESIKQKINSLSLELKKLEEQEKLKVGEFMLDMYHKKDFNSEKIKLGIAKILGDEPENLNQPKQVSEFNNAVTKD